MSLFDKDWKKTDNACDTCICNELKGLSVGEEVEKIIVNGEEIEDLIFVCFDDKTCCVKFIQEDDGDEDERNVVIVDCRKIDALFLEVNSD
ncbi:hypothetical protein [Pseudalkalibacillus berkeleyi]|uniref:Uncharacterized protein n=1 Tax=Pseudalkalibacillus berkeleyi TaxID=1069813 RepID=A0ABS9GW29_9BACL|nr:hypothetical protein [Pseudalkalibacillus berkeleyi]MCF6136899.1 hypothetical protein [Pseudalkalibacillus berkeleyi]